MLKPLRRFTDTFLQRSPVIQFTVWFVLILIIKADTLFAPPVWDTAMGIFPPAIFLFESNFDLMSLVQQQGWWQSGPNVHSLSLWTWVTAVTMSITNHPTTTFFILHLITFSLCALAIALMVRTLYQKKINSPLAILAGLLLLAIPLVLVQIGYMYTESLVMALSILVWVSWHNGQENRAVVLAITAMSIKLTGLIIGLCIVPLLLIKLIHNFSISRLIRLISIPLCYFILSSLYGWLDGIPQTEGWGSVDALFDSMIGRFQSAIDVSLFIIAGMIAAILYSLYKWSHTKSLNPIPTLYKYCIRDGSTFIVIAYPLLFCLGVITMTFQSQLFLYRYAVPLIPFIVLSVIVLAQTIKLQGVFSTMIAAVCVLFAYNYDGRLYKQSLSFSVIEHSHAYQDYVSLQKGFIEKISQLNNQTPIFVSREIYYMTSHPMMGYINEIKPNLVSINKHEFLNLDVADLPDEFYLVHTNRYHGGKRIISIRRALTELNNWHVEPIYWQKFHQLRMNILRIHNDNIPTINP